MLNIRRLKDLSNPQSIKDFDDHYNNHLWIELDSLIKYHRFHLEELLKIPKSDRSTEIKFLIKFISNALKYYEGLNETKKISKRKKA